MRDGKVNLKIQKGNWSRTIKDEIKNKAAEPDQLAEINILLELVNTVYRIGIIPNKWLLEK